MAGKTSIVERLGGTIASGVDRAVYALALSRSERSRKGSRAESLGPIERASALRMLAEHYDRPEILGDPDTFFPTAAPGGLTTTAVRAIGRGARRGEVLDATWESGHVLLAEGVRDAWTRHARNERAHARLYLHGDRPRAAVLLLHGYLGGSYAVEERAWPIEWLYGRGLDVAVPVLPFHGPRATGARPAFPASDPRFTIEGFRQAMRDLRALAAYLRGRGAPAVGAMGMSLGGYTTALFATVEPALAFAVPFIPLASIADFARENGRLVGVESQQREQHELLERVYRCVSPLGRPARVPPQGRLVIAAQNDRITPISHARRIAEHFDAPLRTFHGGHLLQLGRGGAFREVGRLLGGLGLLDPR